MLREDRVEVLEVADFLVMHVLHEALEVRVGAEKGRCLRGVDEDGGQLAGLVDAQGGVEEVALLLRERLHGGAIAVGGGVVIGGLGSVVVGEGGGDGAL